MSVGGVKRETDTDWWSILVRQAIYNSIIIANKIFNTQFTLPAQRSPTVLLRRQCELGIMRIENVKCSFEQCICGREKN